MHSVDDLESMGRVYLYNVAEKTDCILAYVYVLYQMS